MKHNFSPKVYMDTGIGRWKFAHSYCNYYFKLIMKKYYKPNENLTLKNFHFRSLTQDTKETFLAFCNRKQKEARHCQFKCKRADCSSEETAVKC